MNTIHHKRGILNYLLMGNEEWHIRESLVACSWLWKCIVSWKYKVRFNILFFFKELFKQARTQFSFGPYALGMVSKEFSTRGCILVNQSLYFLASREQDLPRLKCMGKVGQSLSIPPFSWNSPTPRNIPLTINHNKVSLLKDGTPSTDLTSYTWTVTCGFIFPFDNKSE